MQEHGPFTVAVLRLGSMTVAALLCLATGAEEVANPAISAALDALAQNRSAYSCYAVTVLSKSRNEGSAWPEGKYPLLQSRTQSRVDGPRVENILNQAQWREDTSDAIPEQSSRFVYDGERSWSLQQGNDNSAVAGSSTSSEKQKRSRIFQNGANLFQGIMYADLDPVDVVLRQARHIERRVEEMDGVACEVLEADTVRGRYALWLDPSKNYAIRKASVTRNKDDIGWLDKPLREQPMPCERTEYTLDVLEFKEIEGRFVPVTARTRSYTKYTDGKEHTANSETRIEDIDFHPDFEAMGAFRFEIPEGAIFQDEDNPQIKYVWRGGRPVPDVDEDDMKSLKESVAALKEEAPALPATPDAKAPSSSAGGRDAQEPRHAGRVSEAPKSAMRYGIGGGVLVVLLLALLLWRRRKPQG